MLVEIRWWRLLHPLMDIQVFNIYVMFAHVWMDVLHMWTSGPTHFRLFLCSELAMDTGTLGVFFWTRLDCIFYSWFWCLLLVQVELNILLREPFKIMDLTLMPNDMQKWTYEIDSCPYKLKSVRQRQISTQKNLLEK